jgi:hypothetical protein
MRCDDEVSVKFSKTQGGALKIVWPEVLEPRQNPNVEATHTVLFASLNSEQAPRASNTSPYRIS